MSYPWTRVLLPFACAYFVSYGSRSINALLGPALARDLRLGDGDLGLLTSTYFLAFGLAQMPVGMALDRFGPRRVNGTLLAVAALGALVFGLAQNLTTLALGRALLGLGMAAALMSSFKAFALWSPPERHASLTGWVMTAGGLGAFVTTGPMEWLLGLTTWRTIFLGLSALILAAAGLIFLRVPRGAGEGASQDWRAQWQGVADIYRSRHFWRYAPMGFAFTGGFMALQGLWATRWMMSVEGLSRAQAAQDLGAMSLAMLGGFMAMGLGATHLVRRGIALEGVYGGAMALLTLALTWIVAGGPGTALAWVVFGACFSLSNLGYGLIAQGFPQSHSGRASTASNMLMFFFAFGLQWGLGLLVETLTSHGLSEPTAFRLGFSFLCLTQAASLAWWWIQRPRGQPVG